MNIELKGTVGDKIAIIGTITQVTIDEKGIEYAYQTSSDADIQYIRESEGIVPYNVNAERAAEEEIMAPIESLKPRPKEEIEENGMTIKRRPGRPKKATIEGAMAKVEQMRARGEI